MYLPSLIASLLSLRPRCTAMQTQMLASVVDSNRKAVEADPNNAVTLSELAKSLFELSMLQIRDEARATLKEG